MAFDYSGIVSTASDLLERFGKQSATLRSVATSVSDPVAGTVTFTQSTSVTVDIVQIAHNEKHTPGALIEDGDLFWFADVLAGMGDEILVGSQLYNVVQAWPVKPGDTFIGCRIQTRGGVMITVNNVINGTDNVINSTDNVVTA